MRLYREYPLSSMSFGSDPAFREALHKFVRPLCIDTVIETGTYLGLGSTRVLADFFAQSRIPKRFLTFEVNWTHFRHAKVNLRPFGFVDCRWGSSVSQTDAVRFIESDEAIVHHQRHSDIWIDDVDDPVAFYSNEIMGSMLYQRRKMAGHSLVKRLARAYGIGDVDFLWDGDQLLAQACAIHKSHKPLIVLDSAGGVGFLEFQTVLSVMQDAEYLLLLDDVHHLKHFRSLRYIQSSAEFKLLAANIACGWALAYHAPRRN